MLSALLFSSTAVYADNTAIDDANQSSGEEVVEVVEPGNTSNDINSSTNQNITDSGNDISEDNNSNTTTENTETVKEDKASLLETSLAGINIGFDFPSIIFGGDPQDPQEPCQHDNEYVSEYRQCSDTQHTVVYSCQDCGEELRTETEDCAKVSKSFIQLEGDQHMEVFECSKCHKSTNGEAVSCELKYKYTAQDGVQKHCKYQLCESCGRTTEAVEEDCTCSADSYTYDKTESSCVEEGDHYNHKHIGRSNCEYCESPMSLEGVCTEKNSEYAFDKHNFENPNMNVDGKPVYYHTVKNECATCGQEMRKKVKCEFDEYVFDESTRGQNKSSQHQMIHYCKTCGQAETKMEDCTFNEWHYNSKFRDLNFFGTTHIETRECQVCGYQEKRTVDCKWSTKVKFKNLEFCPECHNIHDSRTQTEEIVKSVELLKANGEKFTKTESLKDDAGNTHYVYDEAVKVVVTIDSDIFNNDKTEQDWIDKMDVQLCLNTPAQETKKMTYVKGSMSSDENGTFAKFAYTVNTPVAESLSIAGVTVNYNFDEDYDKNLSKLGAKHSDAEKKAHTKNKYYDGSKEIAAIVRNQEPEKYIADKDIDISNEDEIGQEVIWKPGDTEDTSWYSKSVNGNHDMVVTVSGITGKPLTNRPVSLLEKNAKKGIEATPSVAKKEKAYTWGDKFATNVFVSYVNEFKFIIPSDASDIKDGKHVYNVNNSNIGDDIAIYIDNTKPVIEKVDYQPSALLKNEMYYAEDVTVTAVAKDEHLDLDEAKTNIYFVKPEGGAKVKFDMNADDTETATAVTTTSTAKDAEVTYKIAGIVYDKAGNHVSIDKETDFIVDKKAPEVASAAYTSKADRLNGKYYKENVNVSVEVSDTYLDPKTSYIDVSNETDEVNKDTLSEDVKVSDTLKLDVEPEGEHLLTGKIYDKAGNCTVINDKENEFIIDKTAPVIEPVKFDNNSAKSGKYYKAARTAEISIVEKYFTDKGVNVTKTEGLAEVPAMQGFTSSDLKNITKILFDKDGHYGFTVNCVDLAGNEAKALLVDDFVIDTVAPEVTIKFDNHEFKHEKYYKANRTATFELKDQEVADNLSATEADIKKGVSVNKKTGEPKFNAMTGSASNYSGTIVFDEDGEYQITNVEFYDKAGNKAVVSNSSDADYSAEFVVDKTLPVIEVEFDNKSALNNIFYKAKRTATITFTETNFTADQVFIKKSGSDQDAVPGFTGYSKSKDKNVTKINYEKDGRYGFELYTEDLAGNISETYVVDTFVVDMTAPELEITGVENMSANNGSVVPFIKSKDVNINDMSTEITLTGSNNGVIKPTITKTSGTEIFTYTIADLAREKKNDDLYTLSVKLTDHAGNEVEKKVQYSVNRFGSVFVLSDATKAMIDGYYVTKPQDVVITEINVDALSKKEVSVAYDGSVNELREGSAFTTTDSTNSKGWHSISYNIGKSNFNKDGIYSVTVYSEDKASNRQSNQSKEAEVEFLLDKTAPSVIASGIEDGGIYEEENHDFSVNAVDTIGVKEMKIYLNDEKLGSYTASELSQNGGTVVLTIPAKDDYQKVTIQCVDVAGNVTNLAYNNILVSVKAEELLLEDNLTPTSKLVDGTESIESMVSNSSKALVILIVIFAMAICGGAGVYAFKKKKN